MGKEVSGLAGNRHPQIAPYGSFRCRDGWLQLAVGTEAIWRQFAPTIGLDAEDPRFRANHLRVAKREGLVTTIERALACIDRDDFLGQLAGVGVPAGAIRSLDEVYESEQTRSQGLLINVDHSAVGRLDQSAGTSNSHRDPDRADPPS
ncbi:CoA transferase [Mycobacterium sp. 21AC1]|uniref:CoA transferase n=1 Tax=[Mycobacterium] appelbergii TaxID=2939269 RepID=UPI002939215B|nr:CoA transferase [Mycobacterium sp. 21AC1]MDV3129889.1 CoA transferase [Mycobacterium sp. 21AC1]